MGVVLVGGQSRRFGSPKAVAATPVGPLASIAVDALRGAGVDPVVLVGHPERDRSTAALLGLPLVADRRPDAGPLAALATALGWAATGSVVVLPCDLTDIDADTISHLLAVRAAAPEETAVVARGCDGRPDPTVGAWPASQARVVQRIVSDGARRWQAVFDVIEVEMVTVGADTLSDADEPATLHARFGGEIAAQDPERGTETEDLS
ncbi:MAG: molybdenum cofactor guanylyltransferase [Acidimicrobiales bacterium]